MLGLGVDRGWWQRGGEGGKRAAFPESQEEVLEPNASSRSGLSNKTIC